MRTYRGIGQIKKSRPITTCVSRKLHSSIFHNWLLHERNPKSQGEVEALTVWFKKIVSDVQVLAFILFLSNIFVLRHQQLFRDGLKPQQTRSSQSCTLRCPSVNLSDFFCRTFYSFPYITLTAAVVILHSVLACALYPYFFIA